MPSRKSYMNRYITAFCCLSDKEVITKAHRHLPYLLAGPSSNMCKHSTTKGIKSPSTWNFFTIVPLEALFDTSFYNIF